MDLSILPLKIMIGMVFVIPGTAFAQGGFERSQKPGSWQLSDVCDVRVSVVNSITKVSEEIFKRNCYGVTVTKGSSLNIHFSSAHPSLGKPLFSFVLVEGPFSGVHPVSIAVMNLGDREEVILDAETGGCRTVRRDSDPVRVVIQCSLATAARPDGTHLVVISTAMFDNGLPPQIRSLIY